MLEAPYIHSEQQMRWNHRNSEARYSFRVQGHCSAIISRYRTSQSGKSVSCHASEWIGIYYKIFTRIDTPAVIRKASWTSTYALYWVSFPAYRIQISRDDAALITRHHPKYLAISVKLPHPNTNNLLTSNSRTMGSSSFLSRWVITSRISTTGDRLATRGY